MTTTRSRNGWTRWIVASLWPAAVALSPSVPFSRVPLIVPRGNDVGFRRRAARGHDGLRLPRAVAEWVPRGGGTLLEGASRWTSTPEGTFHVALAVLAASTAALKLRGDGVSSGKSDPSVKSLRRRFLAVFWTLRMADWLQVSTIHEIRPGLFDYR